MRLLFKGHARNRMYQKNISQREVLFVLEQGMVVEEYPHDKDTNKTLFCAVWEGRLIHVVISEDPKTEVVTVHTVYEPDPERWEADWQTRRRQ